MTEAAGFSVIRSLVGHGVGRSMHEDPQVPNFVSSLRGPELKQGMTIAIEPMITAGSPDVYIHDDDWSISTVGLLARRPFRAHGGRHRGRASHPDFSDKVLYHTTASRGVFPRAISSMKVRPSVKPMRALRVSAAWRPW